MLRQIGTSRQHGDAGTGTQWLQLSGQSLEQGQHLLLLKIAEQQAEVTTALMGRHPLMRGRKLHQPIGDALQLGRGHGASVRGLDQQLQ